MSRTKRFYKLEAVIIYYFNFQFLCIALKPNDFVDVNLFTDNVDPEIDIYLTPNSTHNYCG